MLARQPSDVAAFERWVARNAWEELNENSVAEVLPVHELVRSTSAARHLSDELRDKVARLNGKERREYFEQWRAKHVVDEVPRCQRCQGPCGFLWDVTGRSLF